MTVTPAHTIGPPRFPSAIAPNRSGYISPSRLGFNALSIPALNAVIGDRICITAGYAALSLIVTVGNLDAPFGYFLNIIELDPLDPTQQLWLTQLQVGGAATSPAVFNIGARGVGTGPGNPIPFNCTTRLFWMLEFSNNSDVNDYTVTIHAICGTE